MFWNKKNNQLKKQIRTLPEYQKFDSKYSWYKPKESRKWLSDFLEYREEVDLFNRNLDKYLQSTGREETAEKQRFIPKEIQLKAKELESEGKLIRTYYLADLPSIASISQLINILNLPIPFTLSYHLKGTKRSKIISRSNSKISALEAQLISEQERGKYKNKEVEKHIDEINRFSDDIVNGSQEAFYLSVYVTITADNQKELSQYDKIFKEETADIQFVFNNCFLNQQKSLLDSLPLVENQEKGKVQHLVHTSAVSNLLPFLSKNTTDHEGIFLGSNLYNGSLVLVDLFKTDNANFNIFGKSGSGKSVTSKLIISRLILRGVQNVIIDPEGEYTKLVRAYHGEVVEFSREEGINPFYIFTNFDKNGEREKPTQTEEQNQILRLKEFFRFFIENDKYDSGVLGHILTDYFEKTKKKVDKRCLPDFLKFLGNINKKDSLIFYEDLMELSEGRSLGGYFSASKGIDLDREIISFNLRKLEAEEVKIPAMYILTSLVQKLADNIDKKTMIYVDEAHLLLKHKITGQFLQALSKTVRKRNTGLVCISQELEDFKEENGGKTIIAQAESNFILKQSNVSVNHIRDKKILPLTEDELRKLTGMTRGQCIYLRQSEHLILKVIPFEVEKELIFT